METDGSRVCSPAPFRWLLVAASCAVSHGITAQESSIPTVLTKQFSECNICPHCRAKKLGADELARSAAAVPSGGPDDMAPLTPSHSLHRELTSRPKSPALPCDVSSVNHMPRTPCTPAVAVYEQDGDAEMTDTTSAAAVTRSSSAALGVDRVRASTAASELERQGKHTTPTEARAHDEDDGFLGAVHSLELTRLQTYGKLEAAHLPFDPACLRSLRVLRVASDDMLAEGTLEALLEGLDPLATPQVHILKCHFATKYALHNDRRATI